MEDKLKGRMKEAAGAFTDDEAKKDEGRVQQRKDQASEEAAQTAKTCRVEQRRPTRPRGSATGSGARTRGHSAA